MLQEIHQNERESVKKDIKKVEKEVVLEPITAEMLNEIIAEMERGEFEHYESFEEYQKAMDEARRIGY